MTQMQAICYDSQGPADKVLQLRQFDRPTPNAGEVLVRVAVSGVNPSDVKTRAGGRGPMAFDLVIPHSDGSGRIEAVGAGVDPSRVGERVWLWNGAWKRAFGTCAEFITVAQNMAVKLPDSASYADAACLGIPAQTAHRGVFANGSVNGMNVLVTGGAGTVGAYAIQMAKLSGAFVITTISGPEKAAHAAAMGADAVINYRDEDAGAQILAATNGAGIDHIVEVEFGGNLAQSRQVLKDNGVIVTYGSVAAPEPVLPFYPMMFSGLTLKMIFAYKLPEEARAAAIHDINQWLDKGALKHGIGARVPLADAVLAHQEVEKAGRIGAVLIDVAEGV